MILVGNQRGGAKDLARHLLKQENEHVEVHELRGFASENLTSALNEAYAIRRGSRCKQFLFSLSLNPPPQENVSTEAFEDAIDRVEAKLGLTGQPRAIVFHEKEGRRHCHAVWSRIKADEMKAVQLSHSHRKLEDITRELFIVHGWQMPRGLMVSSERDPRNFSLAEWQQAKRAGKDARDIKAALQDCWAISDSRAAFAAALEERGYKLARGDRRRAVAVDMRGEPYALAKWVGVKTKSVRVCRYGDRSLIGVKVLLDVDEQTPHLFRTTELREGIRERAVAELEQRRELVTVQLVDALADVLGEHEVDERALLVGQAQRRSRLGGSCSVLAADRCCGERHIGQHVEQVAVLGLDDPLHLGQRFPAETLVGQADQQRLAGIRSAPDAPQFVLVLEELGQRAVQHFQKLRGRQRLAVGAPERGRRHALDVASLSVGELHLDLAPRRQRLGW